MLSRRDFIVAAGAGTLGSLIGGSWAASQAIEPVTKVDNPLQSYPNRDWEQVYHDIYEYDEVDWTVCHPNCTQSCAQNIYLKNGVPIRAEQIYLNEQSGETPSGYEHADVSQNWNPRGCMKGLTLHRRTYEPSIRCIGVRTSRTDINLTQEGENTLSAFRHLIET